MFSWICPKCGNEVPPSKDECPRCAPAMQQQPAQPLVQQPPTPPQGMAPPHAAPAHSPVAAYARPVPQQPRYEAAPVHQAPVPQPQPPMTYPTAPQPGYYPPSPEPKSSGLRDILVTVGVAAILLIAGYFVWNRMNKEDSPAASEAKPSMETPGGATPHPFAKHLELTGFRLREPKPGIVEVKMILVNHSAADMSNLSLAVQLLAKGTDKEVAAFPLKVKSLAPFASTELSASVKTKMRAYELPDWQFLEPRLNLATAE